MSTVAPLVNVITEEDRKVAKARRDLLSQGLVNEVQKKALKYVQIKAMVLSNEYKASQLPGRFSRLGFNTTSDIAATLEYIKNRAPLIIHVNLDQVMEFILKDTHYRNQFETSTSNGTLSHSTRVGWEDRLFNKIYHDAKPTERVKYGVLNMVNDPRGVKKCSQYGTSYFLLKNDMIRLRTTMTQCDSSATSTKLASCEHYAHVLQEYNDEELKAVIQVALGLKPYVESTVISHYKEVQYHGDIRFNRDIEALIVDHSHASNKKMCQNVHRFAEQNGINVIWKKGAKPIWSPPDRTVLVK